MSKVTAALGSFVAGASLALGLFVAGPFLVLIILSGIHAARGPMIGIKVAGAIPRVPGLGPKVIDVAIGGTSQEQFLDGLNCVNCKLRTATLLYGGGAYSLENTTFGPGRIRVQLVDLQELNARWNALYGSDPPDRLRRPLMIQALAYRPQEQALGGLKPATRRLLRSVVGDAEILRPTAVESRRPVQTGGN
jgi:DUF2924 family protein